MKRRVVVLLVVSMILFVGVAVPAFAAQEQIIVGVDVACFAGGVFDIGPKVEVRHFFNDSWGIDVSGSVLLYRIYSGSYVRLDSVFFLGAIYRGAITETVSWGVGAGFSGYAMEDGGVFLGLGIKPEVSWHFSENMFAHANLGLLWTPYFVPNHFFSGQFSGIFGVSVGYAY